MKYFPNYKKKSDMKNYEKKYKEALERAKYLKENTDGVGALDVSACFEQIFPELCESEDERIRKTLIHIVKGACNKYGIKYQEKEIDEEKLLSWLENQGHDGKKWIYEDVYLKEKEQLIQDGIDEVLENPQKYGLEKQGEQKPDNKAESMEYNYITPNPEFFQWIYDRLVHVHNENPNVDFMLSLKERIEDMQKPFDKCEPKFKVGDWVVHDMSDDRKVIRQIVNMTNKSYVLDGEDFNSFYFNDLENDYHLWTIRDAKDGDVLYCKTPYDTEIIVMYLGININNNVDSYCRYNSKLGFNTYITNVLNVENDFITPATKEQYDILFAKMKEAGYEWDSEKKELKMIDSYCQKNCKGYQETGRCFADGECQAKKEAESTWSENDERIYNEILDFFLGDVKTRCTTIDKQRHFGYWLKSIKPNHWKPSEEQIKSLRIALQTMPYSKDKENVLVILEELLKI